MNSEAAVIDVVGVRRTVSGDIDLLSELVGILQDELPGMRSALQLAAARRDGPAVALAAHRLKGSLSALGAVCASTAARIEQAARFGSMETVNPLAAQLESEISNVVPALQTLLNSEEL